MREAIPAQSPERSESTLEMKQTAATVEAGSPMCPEDAHFPLKLAAAGEVPERVRALLQT